MDQQLNNNQQPLNIKSSNNNNIQTPRFKIIQQEIQSIKEKYLASYKAIYQQIEKKQLWRKEIVNEIKKDLIAFQIPLELELCLKKKEQQEFELIYKVKGVDEGQQAWYIIKIDKEKKQQYERDIQKQDMVIDLEEYGQVLYCDYGVDIPKEISKKLHQQFHMTPIIISKQLNEKAWQYQSKQSYEKSIELYTKSLKYDKVNKTTYNNRGFSYLQIQHYNKAIQDFKQSIRLDNNFQNPYKHLAQLYHDNNKFQMAKLYCENALSINQNYYQAQQLYNKIMYKMGLQKQKQLKITQFFNYNSKKILKQQKIQQKQDIKTKNNNNNDLINQYQKRQDINFQKYKQKQPQVMEINRNIDENTQEISFNNNLNNVNYNNNNENTSQTIQFPKYFEKKSSQNLEKYLKSDNSKEQIALQQQNNINNKENINYQNN